MKKIFLICLLISIFYNSFSQKLYYIISSNANDATFNNNIRQNIKEVNDKKKIKSLVIYRSDLQRTKEFQEINNIFNNPIFLDTNGSNCPNSSISNWIECVKNNFNINFDSELFLCDDIIESSNIQPTKSEDLKENLRGKKFKKNRTLVIFHYKKPNCNLINVIPSPSLPKAGERYPLELFNQQPGSGLGYFFKWKNDQNYNVRISLIMDDCIQTKSNPSIDIDININDKDYLVNENGYYSYFLSDTQFEKKIKDLYKISFDDVKQYACTWTVKFSFFCEENNQRQYSNTYSITKVQFACCN